jgi:UDP-2-acetamido-3-amino-2,3-dideoxy-glucuronate N-acetyltransferase
MTRLGLIGCGDWGKNYVQTIKQIDGMQLSWIYNRQNIIPENKLPIGSRFTCDYHSILEDDETKAVIISTPPKTHYQIAKDALEAGKDVLVEKPMTSDSDEALELFNFAREKSRILMVGHIFLYSPAIIEVKKRIKKNEFGDLYYIESRRMGMGPVRSDISAMWNLAPHDISIINHLTGNIPTSVNARGFSFLTKGIEDVADLTLQYDNNIRGNISVSWLHPHKIRETILVGKERMAVFDDTAKNKLKLYDPSSPSNTHTPRLHEASPLENQCRHFLECIETRRQPLTNGYDGYVNVKILEAAQRSIETKREIEIEL